jgi:hypothetical protein
LIFGKVGGCAVVRKERGKHDVEIDLSPPDKVPDAVMRNFVQGHGFLTFIAVLIDVSDFHRQVNVSGEVRSISADGDVGKTKASDGERGWESENTVKIEEDGGLPARNFVIPVQTDLRLFAFKEIP